MCGLPSSGKTTRAQQIVQHLTSLAVEVQVINYESLHIDKNAMYKDVLSEKKGRSAFKAAAVRFLSQNRVVIVDFDNCIKGFRYELHCAVREASTTQCVVYCDVSVDTAREWNDKRDQTLRYTTAIFEDLIRRLEVPNEQKRWDHPLFTIRENDIFPVQDIVQVLLKGKSVQPSTATVPQKVEDSSYVYELDRLSQQIIKVVLDASTNGLPQDEIKIPGTDQKMVLNRRVNLAELNRLRRQYLKIAQLRPPQSSQLILKTFIDFLNASGDESALIAAQTFA